VTTPGHVLIACDKFKGSLTAREVIEHIAAGLRDGMPDVQVRSIIVADGGDGTLEAALAAGFERMPVRCAGPTGVPVDTAYAASGDPVTGLALVEMADACGLIRLPEGRLNALGASSRGVGEVIAAALDAGYRRVVLGIGGSASTDAGAGMLVALGARFLGPGAVDLPDGGGALAQLESVDLSGLHPAIEQTTFTVACDVDNPLLGERGAAAIFGPQKGAAPEDVRLLDGALARVADLVSAQTGRPMAGAAGAGAAGGVGWAALEVLGATMRPGIELVLELSRFAEAVDGARLVITGEGSLDLQTLLGKTPAGVARAARAAGVPVVAVCGRALLTDQEAQGAGLAQVYRLTDLEPDPDVCMREAGPLLRRLSTRIAADQLGADVS
jgi:glycerate kinase